MKRLRQFFFFWLVSVSAISVSAATPARPASKGLSDAALTAGIQARFAKSKIGVEKFQVRVQDGVATIDGKTSVIQRKGVATRLARLAGAKAVVNRIQISDEARAKAAANLDQGRRRVQVKRSEEPGR